MLLIRNSISIRGFARTCARSGMAVGAVAACLHVRILDDLYGHVFDATARASTRSDGGHRWARHMPARDGLIVPISTRSYWRGLFGAYCITRSGARSTEVQVTGSCAWKVKPMQDIEGHAVVYLFVASITARPQQRILL
jgi:hypothetical protein